MTEKSPKSPTPENAKNSQKAAETEVAWDASPAPGTRKSFIFNGVEFAFRYCPPGTFAMGAPEEERDAWDYLSPRCQVTLTRGFWLAETPTTQAQYVALTGTNPSFFSARERNRAGEGKPTLNALRRYLDATGGDSSRLPVETVSWEDAQDFCKALNDAVSLPPGLAFRLPWDAEWEYACRAGTETRFYWGAEFDLTRANVPTFGPLDELKARRGASPVLAGLRIGRIGPENAEAAWNRTTEVGRFGANAWGLCDTLGNVWEWVGDRVDYRLDAPVSSEPRIDPKGDRRGGRGIRGGAWNRSSVSSFGRSHCAQYHCNPTVGFRVAVGSWDAESAAAISEPLDEAAVAAVVASIRTARENAPPADALDANSDAAWDSEPPAGTRKTFDVGGVEFAFRYCPPGTFVQGETSERGYENPGDRRIATLTSGFWIAETPTTRAQFQATNAKPKRIQSGSDLPVSDANWFAAVAFCESLNALNIAPPGFAFRLPTSAEWEFACRAWTLGPFNVDGAEPEELGWFAENSKVGKTRAPQAVRQKRPNAWGLFDMHGNVAEWTSDVSAWRDSSAPVVDPTGPEPEPEPEPKPASKRESEPFWLQRFSETLRVRRVRRGGGFQLGAWASVSGREAEEPPTYGNGFRVVLARRRETPSPAAS